MNGDTLRQAEEEWGPSTPSTAGCATNVSTSICSTISATHARSSKHGRSTTTPDDLTQAWVGSHRRSLQHAPLRGITRTDSPYERGHNGEQVIIDKPFEDLRH